MPASKCTKPIIDHCDKQGWDDIWDVADMLVLIVGVVANAALFWLLMRERKSLSASKVLLYLSMKPVNLIYDAKWDLWVNKNHSGLNTTHPIYMVQDIFNMFNMVGCPLLLTSMCMERYLAVMRPVLYLRVRRWEYRTAVSAVVWAITLSFCVAAVLVDDITLLMVVVSIIISCLFIIMLACLGGVVWSLWQQSPAHTTHRNQRRSDSPLKRQAMSNVLIVVVPSVISYLPVLVLFPMVLYIYYRHNFLTTVMCNIFETSLLFPMMGVLIGPLFYFSRARQMCCFSGTGKTFNK